MKYILLIGLLTIFIGCNKEVMPKKINLIKSNEIVIDIEKENNLSIQDDEIIIPEFKK